MSGRTQLMADKALNLYKDLTPTSIPQTWVTLFTTSPTADHPTSHGAVEWGPSRIRVFPNSGAGSPFWSDPFDDTVFIRAIQNSGSIIWNSITLTVSPSVVLSIGVFDAQTTGNLLTWDLLTDPITVTDGEDRTFGTGTLKIRGD